MPKFITFTHHDINLENISTIKYESINNIVWRITIKTVDGSTIEENYKSIDEASKIRNYIRSQIDNSNELKDIL